MKIFPKLFMLSSKEKIKEWEIRAFKSYNNTAIIDTRYGYVGGNRRIVPKEINSGKNIGKSNETTPYEQACMDAQSKWNKKIDKGYTENSSGESDVKNPMQAQKYSERSHYIVWPCAVQKKLNGFKVLSEKISETEIDYRSKTGKSYNDTLQYWTPYLLEQMKVGEVWDGEGYKHGWTLQKIAKAVKKMRSYTKELEYWVYDVADETKTFEDRFINNKYIYTSVTNLVRRVNTVVVYNEQYLKIIHDRAVEDGFEGLMLRNLLGMYTFNYRSNDLQKYKEFEEDEFEIVGANCATGTQNGCVIWTCKTEEDKEFDVVPKGTLPDRVDKYNNKKDYFGKMLTVRYSELSEDNIPIGNPVGGIEPHGEVIRDYE